eukprot:NODE_14383_length_1112_cov_5.509645.p2 GENE.NODE_14383_length_1112_cov_5.509645~~NODE_14383_length_1112_cov_5.509645.p2  ORF type:complete len:179 (-),score=39.80 NODE_14383_length_1112_cov_5.509645:430-966(-)
MIALFGTPDEIARVILKVQAGDAKCRHHQAADPTPSRTIGTSTSEPKWESFVLGEWVHCEADSAVVPEVAQRLDRDGEEDMLDSAEQAVDAQPTPLSDGHDAARETPDLQDEGLRKCVFEGWRGYIIELRRERKVQQLPIDVMSNESSKRMLQMLQIVSSRLAKAPSASRGRTVGGSI